MSKFGALGETYLSPGSADTDVLASGAASISAGSAALAVGFGGNGEPFGAASLAAGAAGKVDDDAEAEEDLVAPIKKPVPIVLPPDQVTAAAEAATAISIAALKGQLAARNWIIPDPVNRALTRTVAVDGDDDLHPEQELTALRLFWTMYVDDDPQLAVHVAAGFQAGKTGVIKHLFLLCHVNSVAPLAQAGATAPSQRPSLHVHGAYQSVTGHAVAPSAFLATGMNESAYREQSAERMLPVYKSAVYINSRTGLALLLDAVKRALKRKGLTPPLSLAGRDGEFAAEPFTPLLVVVDESRVASRKGNFLGTLVSGPWRIFAKGLH